MTSEGLTVIVVVCHNVTVDVRVESRAWIVTGLDAAWQASMNQQNERESLVIMVRLTKQANVDHTVQQRFMLTGPRSSGDVRYRTYIYVDSLSWHGSTKSWPTGM